MHYHTLHVFFSFLPVPYVLMCSLSLFVSLSLSCLVLRNLSLLRTRYVLVPLPPSLLILFYSMMKRHEMTSLRTFLTKQFIRNARSFYLTSQTLLYSMRLALGDGLLYVRNSRGVPTCSYRSFTLTCMPLILLYLGLLRYSKVHVS